MIVVSPSTGTCDSVVVTLHSATSYDEANLAAALADFKRACAAHPGAWWSPAIPPRIVPERSPLAIPRVASFAVAWLATLRGATARAYEAHTG